MVEANDWRLQGQEKYLKNETLFYKQYADRKAETDHDHCEFCGTRFSNTISEDLKVGYTTKGDYRWICSQCFDDFKQMFSFKIGLAF